MTQSYMPAKALLGQMRRLPEMLRRKFKVDKIRLQYVKYIIYDLSSGKGRITVYGFGVALWFKMDDYWCLLQL